jgi:oleate hydratase
LYGADESGTPVKDIRTAYARNCILARRLVERGVRFALNSRVTDIKTVSHGGHQRVTGLLVLSDGQQREIALAEGDKALITLGSMTDASSLGGMDRAPVMLGKQDGGAWALWQRIAADRPEFGHPAVFCDHVEQSKWVSFTITLHDPTFLQLVRDATGNIPGEGGLITFPKSGWLCSIVIPHQPHFIDQPEDVAVLWGYGLAVDAPGDFVPNPMVACTGREIMTEMLGQLGITTEAAAILASSTCIPCMMPFITSQFLCRAAGDRPEVRPTGWSNLAFMGQFCELPEDVVFTVEYSIRSAQVAVNELLGLERAPPDVYRGAYDPRVLYRAFMALHDVAP